MKKFWKFGSRKETPKKVDFKGKPRFAEFILVKKLGEGGFGEVFYAVHQDKCESEEYVALKRLQETQNPEEIKRFEREIKILFNLRHKNIIEVFEYGEQDGACFYTMELLQGETLGDKLKQGTLPLEDVKEIVVQISSGLDAVHQQGIVHRDVKPDNVFLCEDGLVKILDFGLAKDPKAAIKITLQNAGGTPLYMPPEVQPALAGPPNFNLTPAYDQFAVAAISFEALSG